MQSAARPALALQLLIVPTALVCGALVMVIEVMGSRVIGPFFGVSLFIWTSLITVTLVSLAAGYWVGGVVSHRRGTPDVLYGAILAAGLCALAIPLLRAPVLRATIPLGLRAGALASSAILFGPSLFMLGWVSPLLVRIAARELETVGRTVGGLAALSTIGSFVGTVVTGFFLISWFGVERIFQLVGMVLLALGGAWFVGARRRWVALLLLFAGLVVPAERPLVTKVLPNGTRLEEMHRSDGFYGSLRVVDYSGNSGRVRDLLIDGQIQGGLELGSGLSAYEYAYHLALLPWAARPDGKRCLVAGVGPAAVPRMYEALGVVTDVVDINPKVLDVARRFFGLAVRGDVIADDARHFLATTSRRWDYIVLDVFNGDTTPSHLISLEALQLVASRLEEDGVLAVNLIVGPRGSTTGSIIRTVREVFPHVSMRVLPRREEEGGVTNLILVASRAPLAFEPSRVAGIPIHPLAGLVQERLWRNWNPPPSPEAIVVSDDFNPLDAWDLPSREETRRLMLAATDWDVLL